MLYKDWESAQVADAINSNRGSVLTIDEVVKNEISNLDSRLFSTGEILSNISTKLSINDEAFRGTINNCLLKLKKSGYIAPMKTSGMYRRKE